MSKWEKWRRDLQEIGGWDNELAAVPAGPVREMIEEGDALAAAERERDEAVALLREVAAWRVAVECVAPELGGLLMTFARIDAFLAGEKR